MNLQRFEVFLVLAEKLNYTEAAEQLYTTQGNVSKQILALEKELGIKLFDRSHRSVHLTKEGQIVNKHARRLLAEMDSLKQELQQYKQKTENSLILYGIPTMPCYQIASVFGAFHHLYPEADLIIKEEEGDVLLKALEEGQCDLIFGRHLVVDERHYHKLTMEDDHLVALLPKNHDLAKHKTVSLGDLHGENFLLLGESTKLYQPIVEMCQQAGFTPKVTYHGKRSSLIINLVATGMGISLMMEKIAKKAYREDVVLRPLDVTFKSSLDLVTRRPQKKQILTDFWDFATTYHDSTKK